MCARSTKGNWFPWIGRVAFRRYPPLEGLLSTTGSTTGAGRSSECVRTAVAGGETRRGAGRQRWLRRARPADEVRTSAAGSVVTCRMAGRTRSAARRKEKDVFIFRMGQGGVLAPRRRLFRHGARGRSSARASVRTSVGEGLFQPRCGRNRERDRDTKSFSERGRLRVPRGIKSPLSRSHCAPGAKPDGTSE